MNQQRFTTKLFELSCSNTSKGVFRIKQKIQLSTKQHLRLFNSTKKIGDNDEKEIKGKKKENDEIIKSKPIRKSLFFKKEKNFLTLEHFLLQEKSVKLWRDFLRASRNIPNPIARRETVDWLREEHFEGSQGLRKQYDIARIRELLVFGNVALKRVCGPMELVAALNPKHGSFPKLRGKKGLI